MKYRVRTHVDGNGVKYYTVQYKWLLFWITLKRFVAPDIEEPISFNSFEEAVQEAEAHAKSRKSRKSRVVAEHHLKF